MATNLVALILGRFYTHSCNHSIITTLFQTNFLILSQINSKKNINFILFYALKLTNGNLHESYSVSLSGEKNTINSINFVFDLT